MRGLTPYNVGGTSGAYLAVLITHNTEGETKDHLQSASKWVEVFAVVTLGSAFAAHVRIGWLAARRFRQRKRELATLWARHGKSFRRKFHNILLR